MQTLSDSYYILNYAINILFTKIEQKVKLNSLLKLSNISIDENHILYFLVLINLTILIIITEKLNNNSKHMKTVIVITYAYNDLLSVI